MCGWSWGLRAAASQSAGFNSLHSHMELPFMWWIHKIQAGRATVNKWTALVKKKKKLKKMLKHMAGAWTHACKCDVRVDSGGLANVLGKIVRSPLFATCILLSSQSPRTTERITDTKRRKRARLLFTPLGLRTRRDLKAKHTSSHTRAHAHTHTSVGAAVCYD